MQLIPVYLYPNRITAYTSSSWTNERVRRVYNRNVKIYLGADNLLEFQIKNGDQKPISIANSHVMFSMISNDAKKLLLQKDCTLVSTSQGRISVGLSEEELYDIDLGFYSYSLIQETRSYDGSDYVVTSSKPLYIDEQYGAFSTIEIVGDVQGNLKPSTIVKEFNYTNPAALGENEPKFYTSSLIDAAPNTNHAQSLHTFQFFVSNYSGEIKIQGSISEGANPKVFTDLISEDDSSSIISMTNQTAPIYKNIRGKFNWLRVIHTPATDNLGSLDKVVYR